MRRTAELPDGIRLSNVCIVNAQKLCKTVGEVHIIARFDATSSIHVLTTYAKAPVGDTGYSPEVHISSTCAARSTIGYCNVLACVFMGVV